MATGSGYSNRPPVRDWLEDFDHTDPNWTDDPYPIWAQMRAARPIVHTERFLGCYMPTTYEAVRQIAHDTQHFSSRRIIVQDARLEIKHPAPPITSDPPEHKPAKQILLPLFRPDVIAGLEPKLRAICNTLIDAFIDEQQCDAAQQYANHLSVQTLAHMMGLPDSDGDLFIRWIHEFLVLGITDQGALVRAFCEMNDYFAGHIERRRVRPGNDLISAFLNIKDEHGRALSYPNILGSLRLLLIAGIDTTWSAIGASLWHLAKMPADRAQLIATPALIPTAVEELLRAYSPVTMAREVIKDTVVSGCPVKAGNMVLLSFPAANRDPAVFPDPNKVVLDRKENRHIAFGVGIHRCIGSHLARLEMTIALQEWLKRIPNFWLRPSSQVTWSEGTVRGPRHLPVVFHPQ